MTSDSSSAYFTFIDRPHLREPIRRAIKDAGRETRVVVIKGKGGAGKTRLLEQVLRGLRDDSDIAATKSVLDFYHLATHTREGFMDRLADLLTQDTDAFATYRAAQEKLNRMLLAGERGRIGVQREKVYKAFLDDLRHLSEEKRVIIACDTAEKLIYSTGEDGRRESEAETEAWDKLFADLVTLPNVVLLLAGRPSMEPLIQEWQETLPSTMLTEVTVGPFTPDESRAYWQALIEEAKDQDNPEASDLLDSLTDDDIERAHHFSAGQPIYLTLMLDQIAMGGTPVAFDPEIEVGSDHQEAVITFEKDFVERMQEQGEDWGDLVRELGRLPKGGNPRLIADLLGIDEAEAEEQLESIKRYSFVKTRPNDGRVFLHDEMYRLLQTHIFDSDNDRWSALRTAGLVDHYYTDQLDKIRRRLDELYGPLEEEGHTTGLDVAELSKAHAERRVLLAERLHYRLRNSPSKGYRLYYRYMREAILSGDTDLDRQLQVELESYFYAHEDDLPPEVRQALHSLLLIREVPRAWSENKYDRAIERAAELREEQSDTFVDEERPSSGILDVWEAYARIVRAAEGDIQEATRLLDRAIIQLRNIVFTSTYDSGQDDESAAAFADWRRQAVLAFAYRVRGYLKWTIDDMAASEADLKLALPIWHRLNVQVEWATTLKDLGYSQAEQNKTEAALRHVRHALRAQKELGSRGPVALTYSSLGGVRRIEGNYDEAIQYASIALALGRELDAHRVQGLASRSLAESHRRQAVSERTRRVEDKLQGLLEAWRMADTAKSVFENPMERLRLIETWIEVGCALRDMIRVLHGQTNSENAESILRELGSQQGANGGLTEDAETLQTILRYDDLGSWLPQILDQSREALSQAEELANTAYLHKGVDAAVNKAWLLVYAGRPEQEITQAVKTARSLVPDEYFLERGAVFGGERRPLRIGIWKQIGKLHNLQGTYILEQARNEKGFKKGEVTSQLREAARHFAWALEYSTQYAEDHRDLRGATAHIYEQIVDLSPRQLAAIKHVVQDFSRWYDVDQPAMQRFMEESGLWEI